MVELHIKIRKRIARLAYGENFVSYNEGYKIIFDFDKEWDNIENKIARFILGENYIDCPFSGNEVEIPLIKNADTLEIGVYSDNLYTTTAVKFKVLKSIKDEEKIEILVPEAYPEIEELDEEDLIRVYDKSEEKIGISPLKKLFDKMGVAIDDALTAAKASGEFDGADGITPTIGDNGNWFLGDIDTEKPSRGEKGETGARGEKGDKGDKGDTGATGATGATGTDGKSAYSYAQDGGYTGTEAEFAAKLAAEGLDKALYVVNITGKGITHSADKTFEEVFHAYNEGKYSIVADINTGGTILPLTIANFRNVFFCAFDGEELVGLIIKNDNTVQVFSEPVAFGSSRLPNPYPLTFTGAVNETYDGSSAKTIEIPSGGGGNNELTLLADINFDGNTAHVFEYTGLDDVSEIYIVGGEIKSALDNLQSSFSLRINDIEISTNAVLPILKASETDTWNSYYIAKFNGVFWEPFKSPKHGGAFPTGHIASASYPNSIVLNVGKAKKLCLVVSNPSYKPVTGWMKIWVR